MTVSDLDVKSWLKLAQNWFDGNSSMSESSGNPTLWGTLAGQETVPWRGFLPLPFHSQPGTNSAALVPGGERGKSFI